MPNETDASARDRSTPDRREWSWYDVTPTVLLALAALALLALVVVTTLGWLF